MDKKLYEHKMDEVVELFLLIKSTAERKTKAGKPFLTITFQDTSGEMTGNLWDVSPQQLEMFTPTAVVHVKGKREEYNGQPQLRISRLCQRSTEQFVGNLANARQAKNCFGTNIRRGLGTIRTVCRQYIGCDFRLSLSHLQQQHTDGRNGWLQTLELYPRT